MKPGLIKLTLIAGCALTALPASAQPSAQPSSTAATTPAKAPVLAPKALTAAVNLKAGALASVTTVTAAGSVIVLSDGIVANATLAQIQPPADGFVYER